MDVLNTLKEAIKTAGSVIKWGAGLQETTRKSLVADLQAICANCETAYDAVLVRLVPIKNAFSDPNRLAAELRSFAADPITRSQFKPEGLCTQVDQLLAQLDSNLAPLKYSIDVRRIRDLRGAFMQFGNVDKAIFDSYDQFAAALDQIATQIQTGKLDPREAAAYVQHVIDDFADEVRSLKNEMRDAKAKVVGSI
jgi:hypothetical protein